MSCLRRAPSEAPSDQTDERQHQPPDKPCRSPRGKAEELNEQGVLDDQAMSRRIMPEQPGQRLPQREIADLRLAEDRSRGIHGGHFVPGVAGPGAYLLPEKRGRSKEAGR